MSFASEASASSVSVVPTQATYSVVVNEVMWMGSDLSTADEWLELAAFSDDAVALGMPASLSGWTLKSAKDGGEQIVIRFTSQAQLPVGGYGIVSNYPESQSRIAGAPLAVSTGMSLANTKLLLRLYDDKGVLRDEVDDGIGNPFAGVNTSTQKGSMERIDQRMPGTVVTNWKTATVSVGFDPVPFALFGTPGYANGALPVFSASSSQSSQPSSAFSSGVASYSSAAASVVSSSTSSVAPVSTAPVMLRIQEVMPDPVGSDDFEWVEITNAGSGTVSTAGMTLSMTGSTLRPLPLQDILPGETVLLLKEQTHLTLSNAGGTVVLKKGIAVLDFVTYPALPEGVSFGTDGMGAAKALCLPTPGTPNASSGSIVGIDVQSGMPVGESVTLNLGLRSVAGTTDGGTCHWTYLDGYVSDSCNPPSHSINAYGAGVVTLTFTDYCGNTMSHTLDVFVTRKPSTLRDDDMPGLIPFSCTPSAFTGALITEFLPNPGGDEVAGEWIEITNTSGKDLPLCGWSVEDASGTRYDLRHFRLPLDETLVFTRKQTGIALNNDADALRLIAPDPAGGSGNILQEIPFTKAPTDQSFALRDDGNWIWTSTRTPGSANAFPDVILPIGAPKARLAATMPNPDGKDEGLEWIEIENLTGRPLWLQKWVLRADKDVSLSGKAIHPYATKRFTAESLGISLRNSSGSVRLFDDMGAEQTPLVWNTARDDEVIASPTFATTLSGTVKGVSNTGDVEIESGDTAVVSSFLYIDTKHAEISKYEKCNDLITALIINKKAELYFNSIEEGAIMKIEGHDVAEQLLKNGCAYRNHLSKGGILLGYDVFELEAKSQRRGIWSTGTGWQSVLAMQSEQDVRRVVMQDGLVIESAVATDFVSSGTVLFLRTNLPATIFVSFNESPFAIYQTGSVLQKDQFVQAYAELNLGNETILRSSIFEHAYILKRDSYERQQLLSEVFPSPKKGDAEWIELHNGSERMINLAGWQIDDGMDEGSKPYLLHSDMSIDPHSYLVLKNMKVAWNNGGDTVRLIAPDGTVVDSLVYPKMKTGLAFTLGEASIFCISEKPTPSLSNICYLSPKKTKKSNSRSALNKNKKSSSNTRKILYKNIVLDMPGSNHLQDIFAALDTRQIARVGDAFPFRRVILFFLVIYIGCLASYSHLRRY